MSQPNLHDYPSYLHELQLAFGSLRSALARVIDAVVPPQGRTVRSCARQLDLRAGVTYKLLTLASASDPATGLNSMLGRPAWQTVVKALRSRGAAESDLQQLAEAVSKAERLRKLDPARQWMVRIAAAGGQDSDQELKARLELRRSSFQITAEILGVSAKARIARFVMAPSATAGRIDVLQWTVFEDLRRVRPGPPTRLVPRFPPPSAAVPAGRPRAVVDAGDCCPLVPDLSSPAIAGHVILSNEEEPGARFPGGSVSLAASPGTGPSLRATFAAITPATGSLFAEHDADEVTFDVGANLPVEWLMLDLLVDRRIELASIPRAGLFASRDGLGHWEYQLPVKTPIEEIEPAVSKQRGRFSLPSGFSWFRALDAEILERSDRLLHGAGVPPPERFRCWRVAVRYPLLSTLLWAGFRLPLREPLTHAVARRRSPRNARIEPQP